MQSSFILFSEMTTFCRESKHCLHLSNIVFLEKNQYVLEQCKNMLSFYVKYIQTIIVDN